MRIKYGIEKRPLCPVCNKPVRWYGHKSTRLFFNTCCHEHEVLIRKQNIKKAVQEKYGVDNVFQLEDVKEKSKQTCFLHYGVEYSTQCDRIKEKTFQTSGRGSYRAEDVDSFFREVSASYEQMFKENTDLISPVYPMCPFFRLNTQHLDIMLDQFPQSVTTFESFLILHDFERFEECRSYILQILPKFGFVWYFLIISLGITFCEEEHRYEVPFPSYSIGGG